jgi:hypothetical protein
MTIGFDEHRQIARDRFFDVMKMHIENNDWQLTDDELVRTAFRRYEKLRGAPLIDPNE